MQMIIKVLSPILMGVAQKLISSLAQNVWDSFWDMVMESIKQAEQVFKDNGRAEVKKQWVIDRATAFLKLNSKTSRFQMWAVKVFLGKVIDNMIDEMNKNEGKCWSKYILDLKKYWADRIPYID